MGNLIAVTLKLADVWRVIHRISTKWVRIEKPTRQPTMRRAYTSIPLAAYGLPCQVETWVISGTQSWLGRFALNTRLTRSSGHGARPSLTAVRITLPVCALQAQALRQALLHARAIGTP